MRVVFCGTPDFAVPSLKALIDEGHEIVGVFTQPDRPVGRKKTLQAPAVKLAALEMGLDVYQFEDIRKEEAVETLRSCRPDVMVTAAFGQILSEENLSIAPLGCINVHGSLLPKYRGAAPIQCAIINGETITGVTTMFTVLELDAGDILMQKHIEIEPDETSGELFDKMALLGAKTLVQTLDGLKKGVIKPLKQEESNATMCKMLKKSDSEIDWTKSAREIHNLVRGTNPWPVAHTLWAKNSSSLNTEKEEIQIKIWKTALSCYSGENKLDVGEIDVLESGVYVGTGEGNIELIELQKPGGKAMRAADFARGFDIKGGRFLVE